MYSSLTFLQDVLLSKLHYPYLYYGLYYKSSEFGNVMLSLLDSVDPFEKIVTYTLLSQADYTTDIDFANVDLLDDINSFEKIVTYMLLLQADYTTDIDFANVNLLDDISIMEDKNIYKKLHLNIFYELAYKMEKVTYYNSRLRLEPSLETPIQNVILANLFVNIVLINSRVRDFAASILSYITLLM